MEIPGNTALRNAPKLSASAVYREHGGVGLCVDCLFLRDSFQCFLLLSDPLIQIRHAYLNLLLDTVDYFLLLVSGFKNSPSTESAQQR